MNLARVRLPALVLKMMEVERVRVTSQRNHSWASMKSGQLMMTCSAVWVSVWLHWQSCGSGTWGQCLALYSPVKACSISNHMVVQKIGQVNPLIPDMNSGGCPEGGWCSVQYMGSSIDLRATPGPILLVHLVSL
jgi:hypothetical protein